MRSKPMKGIPFSAPLIPLVMDGTKTQTRRVVKAPPELMPEAMNVVAKVGADGMAFFEFDMPRAGVRPQSCSFPWVFCPYGKVGDILYVKENLHLPDDGFWRYKADDALVLVHEDDKSAMLVWAHHKPNNYQSSRFMPRWAARTFIRLKDVRLQRLQAIGEDDAFSEGARGGCFPGVLPDKNILSHAEAFAVLWDSINAKTHPWHANEWVWALTFERVESGAAK